MLDLHTHILHGMDDGSRSLKQSIAMLRREAKLGVDRVVCTPHFYAFDESPERFLERRSAAMEALDRAAAGKRLPERIAGAEVAYFGGISRAEGIERFCIGNTRAMLIEMPFCRWDRSVLDELIFLKMYRGINPILAHVERYMWYQPPGTMERLSELGIRTQVNATFFLRWQTSLPAMRMLKRRRIQFIGSDCHDMKRRPPDMGTAISRIEKRLGESAVKYLVRMERQLLEGE